MRKKGDPCPFCSAETDRSQIYGEGPFYDAHISYEGGTNQVTWESHETNIETGETTIVLGFGDH